MEHISWSIAAGLCQLSRESRLKEAVKIPTEHFFLEIHPSAFINCRGRDPKKRYFDFLFSAQAPKCCCIQKSVNTHLPPREITSESSFPMIKKKCLNTRRVLCMTWIKPISLQLKLNVFYSVKWHFILHDLFDCILNLVETSHAGAAQRMYFFWKDDQIQSKGLVSFPKYSDEIFKQDFYWHNLSEHKMLGSTNYFKLSWSVKTAGRQRSYCKMSFVLPQSNHQINHSCFICGLDTAEPCS